MHRCVPLLTYRVRISVVLQQELHEFNPGKLNSKVEGCVPFTISNFKLVILKPELLILKELEFVIFYHLKKLFLRFEHPCLHTRLPWFIWLLQFNEFLSFHFYHFSENSEVSKFKNIRISKWKGFLYFLGWLFILFSLF